jgi:hypothetical protein
LERAEGNEWEDEVVLTLVSAGKLENRLKELSEEGRAFSYRRRLVQGRIGLIPADLHRGSGVALSTDVIAWVLWGRGG